RRRARRPIRGAGERARVRALRLCAERWGDPRIRADHRSEAAHPAPAAQPRRRRAYPRAGGLVAVDGWRAAIPDRHAIGCAASAPRSHRVVGAMSRARGRVAARAVVAVALATSLGRNARAEAPAADDARPACEVASAPPACQKAYDAGKVVVVST